MASVLYGWIAAVWPSGLRPKCHFSLSGHVRVALVFSGLFTKRILIFGLAFLTNSLFLSLLVSPLAGNFSCASGQRACASGQCISAEWWCDYFPDCLDKSDELNCTTERATVCDPVRQFRCDSGQCIPVEYRCLQTADPRQICADRSNLYHCANWTCHRSDQIKCAGAYCIDAALKCNEKLDCPVLSDWADEQFCRKCPIGSHYTLSSLSLVLFIFILLLL